MRLTSRIILVSIPLALFPLHGSHGKCHNALYAPYVPGSEVLGKIQYSTLESQNPDGHPFKAFPFSQQSVLRAVQTFQLERNRGNEKYRSIFSAGSSARPSKALLNRVFKLENDSMQAFGRHCAKQCDDQHLTYTEGGKTRSRYFWSSSVYPDGPDYASGFSGRHGDIAYNRSSDNRDNADNNSVRCVVARR